jgi:hypothetical protein
MTIRGSRIDRKAGWVLFRPRLLRVGERQSVASAFEIGLHNASLAITIPMSPTLLNSTVMAMPSVTYGSHGAVGGGLHPWDERDCQNRVAGAWDRGDWGADEWARLGRWVSFGLGAVPLSVGTPGWVALVGLGPAFRRKVVDRTGGARVGGCGLSTTLHCGMGLAW